MFIAAEMMNFSRNVLVNYILLFLHSNNNNTLLKNHFSDHKENEMGLKIVGAMEVKKHIP